MYYSKEFYNVLSEMNVDIIEFQNKLKEKGIDPNSGDNCNYEHCIELKKICNEIEEFRTDGNNFKYELSSLIFMIIMAVLGLSSNIREIHNYIRSHYKKFSDFIYFANDCPSYTTLRLILQDINPEQIMYCMGKWFDYLGIKEVNYDYKENNTYFDFVNLNMDGKPIVIYVLPDSVYNSSDNDKKKTMKEFVSFALSEIFDNNIEYNECETSNFNSYEESEKLGITHLAIDGKTVRGSGSNTKGVKSIHVSSAFNVTNRVCVSSELVDSKSNEITANENLIDKVNPEGVHFSFDALGTQRILLGKINESGGWYTTQAKDNQKKLRRACEDRLNCYRVPYLTIVEYLSDRIEIRKYYITNNVDGIEDLGWKGVKSIGRIDKITIIGDKKSEETHYYIMNYFDKKEFVLITRNHWGVENKLHYILDNTFNEDKTRVWKGNSPFILNLLKKFAITILYNGLKLIDELNISIGTLADNIRMRPPIVEKIFSNQKFCLNDI